MKLNEYQKLARGTAVYPDIGNNPFYPTLGLCGEAGEIAEKIKKVMRDGDGVLTEVKKTELKKGLGDVLWYIAALCTELDLDMNDVAENNIAKRLDRKKRNVIKGDGDNR